MSGGTILSGSCVVARNQALLTAEADGELLAMSVERGFCFGLDSVGTRIWALIEQPRTVDSICETLLDEYDVDAELCRCDVGAFIAELQHDGLVTVQRAGDLSQ